MRRHERLAKAQQALRDEPLFAEIARAIVGEWDAAEGARSYDRLVGALTQLGNGLTLVAIGLPDLHGLLPCFSIS